jgi:hypothetical protein
MQIEIEGHRQTNRQTDTHKERQTEWQQTEWQTERHREMDYREATPIQYSSRTDSVTYQTFDKRLPILLAHTIAMLPNVVSILYALPSAPSGHKLVYIMHSGRN